MIFRLLVSFSLFWLGFFAEAETLASISYKGKKGPVTIQITLKEFTDTYRNIRQIAPNAPSVKQFFEEYLRYRVGLEHAYNDPKLIKNPSIRNMFADPLLKEGFEQMLYKSLAEKKLKKKIGQIEKQTRKLSKSVLLRFYRKNPEFDFHFIVINTPIEATPAQSREALSRAKKIYSTVRKSKKPFTELVNIYSDDRISGQMTVSRNKNNIYPTVYQRLTKMKNGQVSSPIKTDNGYYIVKLNRKVPFGEANRVQIKNTYFSQKRSEALAQYFNGLKSKYKIKTNKGLLSKVR